MILMELWWFNIIYYKIFDTFLFINIDGEQNMEKFDFIKDSINFVFNNTP